MRTGLILGVVVLSGGCAGVRPELAGTETGGRERESTPLPVLGVDTRLGMPPRREFPPERIVRFKSEDQAMRFENSPMEAAAPGRREFLPEESVPRLPRSLMDPWRSFGPSGTSPSELLWSRGIPGVTESGFFGADSGWVK